MKANDVYSLAVYKDNRSESLTYLH